MESKKPNGQNGAQEHNLPPVDPDTLEEVVQGVLGKKKPEGGWKKPRQKGEKKGEKKGEAGNGGG